MKNILVRRGVYSRTISPEPRKGLGSPTENYVHTADAIELKAHSGQFNCAHSVFAFSIKFSQLYYHYWMIWVNKMKIKQ